MYIFTITHGYKVFLCSTDRGIAGHGVHGVAAQVPADLRTPCVPPRQHDPPLRVGLHQVRLGRVLHASHAQRLGKK